MPHATMTTTAPLPWMETVFLFHRKMNQAVCVAFESSTTFCASECDFVCIYTTCAGVHPVTVVDKYVCSCADDQHIAETPSDRMQVGGASNNLSGLFGNFLCKRLENFMSTHNLSSQRVCQLFFTSLIPFQQQTQETKMLSNFSTSERGIFHTHTPALFLLFLFSSHSVVQDPGFHLDVLTACFRCTDCISSPSPS